MITKEINDLFTALVRARLFLPNKDGVRTFARLLALISMKQGKASQGYMAKELLLERRKRNERNEILPRSKLP